MSEDRNLVFGAMAVQADLINADQLAQACAIWSKGNAGSLPEVLCEQGWLLPQDRAHVDYLVDRRLAKFGGDIRASFAGCPPEIRSVLASVYDTSTASTLVQGTIAFGAGASVVGETPPAKTGGRYSLSTLHAAGGIGEIWLARDTDLHRDVAVKRLQARQSSSAANKQRFLREARITGQLDHPGIVPVYEICIDETDGQPYYSMRFLKGGTLTDAVVKYHQQRKSSGSDPRTFLGLLSAFCIVCNTVAFAHSKGIIHRDLKCDNVILGDYGEVVVIDWGLAKEVGSDETTQAEGSEPAEPASTNPAATLAGHILGTPAYMAPEQAAGRLDLIGPPTDVYGLCAILYEILCGQPPLMGTALWRC